MRSYIRHPSNMPVEFQLISGKQKYQLEMFNVGMGGLCFIAQKKLKKGMLLQVTIPYLKTEFKEECLVIWCKKKEFHYQVGVKFLNDQTAFRMRMIEQICYIENYRKDVLAKEGRALTSKEASDEWIVRFADQFPKG